MQASLKAYKETIESIDMNSGDRKKLLALPFYLAKRSQLPEPRYGMKEFELFRELTGKSWYHDSRVVVDPEHKITEFDYENFVHPALLPEDRDSADFKKAIRLLNLTSQTQLEAFQEAKENFKKLMPLLRGLTEAEQEAFIHKV
jgi:hypothetical protein